MQSLTPFWLLKWTCVRLNGGICILGVNPKITQKNKTLWGSTRTQYMRKMMPLLFKFKWDDGVRWLGVGLWPGFNKSIINRGNNSQDHSKWKRWPLFQPDPGQWKVASEEFPWPGGILCWPHSVRRTINPNSHSSKCACYLSYVPRYACSVWEVDLGTKLGARPSPKLNNGADLAGGAGGSQGRV